MSTATINNPAGVDYGAYFNRLTGVDPFVAAFTPLVTGSAGVAGDDTFTLVLDATHSLRVSGDFTGTMLANAHGTVYKGEFLLNGSPDATAAWPSAERFTLDQLKVALAGGTAGVTALVTAAPITFTGNNGNDSLFTGAANDTLNGGAGNDTLNSGDGTDVMNGGNGNDTYINPGATDTINEANTVAGGIDTVSTDATYTLAANVERLFLQGVAAINGTGNAAANQITGNTANNLLSGLDNNDTLLGGAGADTLQGGLGSDRLTGGTQRDKLMPGTDTVQDVLVFNILNDSTGVTRDVISGMDFNNEDKIDLPGVPTAIAAAITVGTLSTATFNADLVAAVTAAKLGAGQAVIFDPNAGNQDVAGTVYLIVDANGIAGYQANQDWVFQLENHTGTIDTSDFI